MKTLEDLAAEIDELVDVATRKAEIWGSFWRRHARAGRDPDGALVLDTCTTCGFRLTLMVPRSKPLIIVVCRSCGAVKGTFKLEPGE